MIKAYLDTLPTSEALLFFVENLDTITDRSRLLAYLKQRVRLHNELSGIRLRDREKATIVLGLRMFANKLTTDRKPSEYCDVEEVHDLIDRFRSGKKETEDEVLQDPA